MIYQEKQIQEEVAEEFESMQKEALEAKETSAALSTEMAILKGKSLLWMYRVQ